MRNMLEPLYGMARGPRGRLAIKLAILVAIKLFIMFFIFKLFFFPDLLSRDYDNDADRAQAVRHSLM